MACLCGNVVVSDNHSDIKLANLFDRDIKTSKTLRKKKNRKDSSPQRKSSTSRQELVEARDRLDEQEDLYLKKEKEGMRKALSSRNRDGTIEAFRASLRIKSISRIERISADKRKREAATPGFFQAPLPRKANGKQRLSRAKLKSVLVHYRGGRCLKCERADINPILEFHHRDPAKKSFSMSAAIGAVANEEDIRLLIEECDKCDTLCPTCHRLLHYNEQQSRIKHGTI